MNKNMAAIGPLDCRAAGCAGQVGGTHQSFAQRAATRTWGFVGKYHVTDERGDGLCCPSIVDEPEVNPPQEAILVCKRALKMLAQEVLL